MMTEWSDPYPAVDNICTVAEKSQDYHHRVPRRHGKLWKVVEFRKTISRPGKLWKFYNCTAPLCKSDAN